MPNRLELEADYPDLFAPLSATDRDAVLQTLASSWHEGWKPNRRDVADLVDLVTGAIDTAEYERRSAAAAADA
ncbi:antitoxin VbhA family protein [Curtobacterium sp. MCBD17_026]|uniref:antitoxin VbhA family protein n=1 Tax=Curtobacterium sp. MCBD17_026 TaxID=2175621 RepID=UPI000DAA7BE9|nr:antitoxin VbhA family protein [Curtobacterium sp. MCBD17_026]WIB72588.1 antitoxin VbhA family protein [Curtobacterium sp. MCBD17_026]